MSDTNAKSGMTIHLKIWRQARGADSQAYGAITPCAAHAVIDNHLRSHRNPLCKSLSQLLCRPIRILRQQ